MSELSVKKKYQTDVIIALVGNPNVGKSTVFNSLTGMKQHTGNWPGKTVEIAEGRFEYKGKGYILVDLPGTYSLNAYSEEERVANEFITSEMADIVVFVGDATCLERNLSMALQVMRSANKIIFCLNLLDEAERKGVHIDVRKLEQRLGIPVVKTSAVSGDGLRQLQEKIRNMSDGFVSCAPLHVEQEKIVECSSEIVSQVIVGQKSNWEPADKIVLGKWTGYAIIMVLLIIIFYITISGANYLSDILEKLFTQAAAYLSQLMSFAPDGVRSLMIDGIYWTVSSVISVMLPPMLIFYPLFSFLEDLGYLPRAAFLLDHAFSKCGGCGKQALTITMGFGCNTVGVMGARIISSPKERLVAILTNAMTPCNGRFPTMILLISMFLTRNPAFSSLALCGFVLFSVLMSMLVSAVLNKVLKKEDSYFILELPPYRMPRIKYILIRALRDRTAYILGRAIMISAPSGVVIWLLNHITVSGKTLLVLLANLLDPFGVMLGMSGAILLAFVLSFPANELLIPLLVMILQAMTSSAFHGETGIILHGFGITWKTALCMLVFSMFHWPCGTTCMTIKKETGSIKWMLFAIIIPTAIGIMICASLALLLKGL